VILSIPAIVLGHQAKKEIDRTGGRETGRGMAKAGIILGWIGIVLTLLGVAAFILFAVIIAETDPTFDENGFDQDPFSALKPALAVLRGVARLFV